MRPPDSDSVKLHAALRWAALLLLVAPLLWLFRPVDVPPVVQLREAASVPGLLLLAGLGAGVAAMATVQFWKVMFRPRAAFHLAMLSERFGEHVGQVLGLDAPSKPPLASDGPASATPPSDGPAARQGTTSSVRDSPAAMVEPARPETRYSDLLDNPTELVMGQIRSAADYILLRPTGYEQALVRLAGTAGRTTADTYLDAIRMSRATASTETDEKLVAHTDDTLVALRFFIEQHLNLVHVELSAGWRRRVRVVAVAVAGAIGLLAIVLTDVGAQVKLSALFAAAVWGGYFSWLTRDLTAWIERRRM